MNQYYNVKRLALVLAVQAEIEGMKAVNKQNEIIGAEPCFNYSAFSQKAEDLRNLAHCHDEQL